MEKKENEGERRKADLVDYLNTQMKAERVPSSAVCVCVFSFTTTVFLIDVIYYCHQVNKLTAAVNKCKS